MEFASMTCGRIHILRVDPGEDVLESIQRFLKQANVQQAVVLGGYGTLAAYHLHWVTHNRIPTRNHFERGEGGFELLSMSGLVVGGEPHIHVTLSTPDGAFGYVLCQAFFAEVEGMALNYRRVRVAVEGMGEGQVTRLVFNQDMK
jgi:predicted DNA-binding protein with PD1-like motif